MIPLGRNLFALFTLHAAARAVALAFHRDAVAAQTGADIAATFLHGLRFDAAVLAVANLPWFAMSTLPRSARFTRALDVVFESLFLAVNGALLAAHAYGSMPVVANVALGLFGMAVLHRLRPAEIRLSWRSLAVTAALVAVAARGGWQADSLRPLHAFASLPPALAPLALNAPFTRWRAPTRTLPDHNDFRSDVSLLEALGTTPATTARTVTAKSSVIVILAGRGEANALLPGGMAFRNAYTNHLGAIEAFSSLVTGVPALQEGVLASSAYAAVPVQGFGSLFARQGYEPVLVTTSRDVRTLATARLAGFRRIIVRRADSDLRAVLASLPAPFAAVVFDPESRLEPMKLLAALTPAKVDDAVSKAFIVMTAVRGVDPQGLGPYRVPLAFWQASRLKSLRRSFDAARPAQLVDLMPTLLDDAGFEEEQLAPFGHSLLDPAYDGVAIHRAGSAYRIVDGERVVEWNPKRDETKFLDLNLNVPEKNDRELRARLELRLRAMVEWHHNGLNAGRLYDAPSIAARAQAR